MATSKRERVNSPIIVALDFNDKVRALTLVDRLDPRECRLKVGKQMFTLFGPDFVKLLISRGFDVFLDLKFHDIPNTVAGALQAAAELGVWMVNVHASGGEKMLTCAKDSLKSYGWEAPLLIAVTVLTHMDDADLPAVGIQSSVEQQVSQLAKLAANSGCDGIVCSPLDLSYLKPICPSDFNFVTPGVRERVLAGDDQTRVMTAGQAIKAGAKYLVIGRPLTKAVDPMAALNNFLDQTRTNS